MARTPSGSCVGRTDGNFREDGGSGFRTSRFAVDGIAGPVRQDASYSTVGCAERLRGQGIAQDASWLFSRRTRCGAISPDFSQ